MLDDLATTSEGNFSCSGVNEAGNNFGDLYYLDIQGNINKQILEQDKIY